MMAAASRSDLGRGAVKSAAVLPSQNIAVLGRRVLGTDLTWAGAIAITATGPAFWFVADLVWIALPA